MQPASAALEPLRRRLPACLQRLQQLDDRARVQGGPSDLPDVAALAVAVNLGGRDPVQGRVGELAVPPAVPHTDTASPRLAVEGIA
jgi:hypothetical protein